MLARPWWRLPFRLASWLALGLLAVGCAAPANFGLGPGDWSDLAQLPSGRLAAEAQAAAVPACDAPRPAFSLSARFEDGLHLRGYDLDSPRPAGDFVVLTLYWEALASPAADHKVFVHVLSPEGDIMAQGDGYPLGGAVPTSDWAAGTVHADTYFVDLAADLPPGSYDITVGLYEESTGRRLPLVAELPTTSPEALLLPEPLQVTPALPERKRTSH